MSMDSGEVIAGDLQELLDVKGQFLQKKSQLEGIVQDIQRQVGSMSGWKGSAHVNFVELMERWTREAQNIHLVLEDVSRDLGEFEQKLRQVGETGARRFHP